MKNRTFKLPNISYYGFVGITVLISVILKLQRHLVKYIKKYFFYQIFVMRNRDFDLNSSLFKSAPPILLIEIANFFSYFRLNAF
jgi:hypothetical protein